MTNFKGTSPLREKAQRHKGTKWGGGCWVGLVMGLMLGGQALGQSPLRPQVGSEINVRALGVKGDGSADDSAALQAINDNVAKDGDTLDFPGGADTLYVLDNVVLTKAVNLRGHGSRLKHKANSVGDMISITKPGLNWIEGLIFDGNMAHQPTNGVVTTNTGGVIYFADNTFVTNSTFTPTYWHSCLTVWSTNLNWCELNVRQCYFTNFVFAGFRWIDTWGEARLNNCKFLDGAEQGGIVGLQSSGINFRNYLQNTTSIVAVANCDFRQTSLPSSNGIAPGGLIVSGRDQGGSNAFVHPLIQNNFFERVGQTYAANHIGAVDLYEETLDAIVQGNFFKNCAYVPAKLQNGGRIIFEGNVLDGAVDVTDNAGNTEIMVWIDPNERSQGSAASEPNRYDTHLILNNIVANAPGKPGIYVSGINANGRGVLIQGNTVTNCAAGAQVVNWNGPVTVIGNHFQATNSSAGALTFDGITGNLKLIGNDCIGYKSMGIKGTSGMTGADVIAEGNTSEVDTSGYYAFIWYGVKSLNCVSGRYGNTAGGGTAVKFDQDVSGNHILDLNFDQDANVVYAGSLSYVQTNVNRWRGMVTYNANPNGASGLNAFPGTLLRRIDSGNEGFYQHRGGVTNTTWYRFWEESYVQLKSADYTVLPGDAVLDVSSAGGNRIITLPLLPELGGLHVYKSSSDGNTVTILTNGTGSTSINGTTNYTLSSQWDWVQLEYVGGGAWRSKARSVSGGGGGSVSDTAFSSAWDGQTTTAPSQNAVYDIIHSFDTDDDGKVNVLDMGAGVVKTDAGGVVSAATAETDYVTPSGAGTLANKTLTTPTIADFTNAGHTHQNTAGGGTLNASALGAGTIAAGRMPAMGGDAASSAGSVTLTIQPGVVTYAKIQNVSAANKFLGSGSGGSGSAPTELSITGTANQVVVTPGASGPTLSTPQDIGTGSSVTYAALNLSGLTASRFVKTDASKNLASYGAALIGVADGGTGLGTLTVNTIPFGNGTGALLLSDAPVNSGDILFWTGSTWSTKPFIINRTGTPIDVVNTTTETSIYTNSIPANGMSINRTARLILSGDWLNNSSGSSNITIRVYFGTTKMIDSQSGNISASANRSVWRLDLRLSNLEAANSQMANLWFAAGSRTASTAGQGTINGTGYFMGGQVDATAAEDTTAAKGIGITVQHSGANASESFRMKHGSLWIE